MKNRSGIKMIETFRQFIFQFNAKLCFKLFPLYLLFYLKKLMLIESQGMCIVNNDSICYDDSFHFISKVFVNNNKINSDFLEIIL